MRQVICFGVQFILCYGPFALDVWCDKILIWNYHSIPHSRDEFNTLQFLYFINHLSSIFYFYYWMMNTIQKRWVVKVIQSQEKTTDLKTKNLRRFLNSFPDKCDASFPLLLTPSSKKSPKYPLERRITQTNSPFGHGEENKVPAPAKHRTSIVHLTCHFTGSTLWPCDKHLV